MTMKALPCMVVTVAIVLVTMPTPPPNSSCRPARDRVSSCSPPGPNAGLIGIWERPRSLSDSSLSESSQGDDYDLVFADDFDNDLFTNRSDDEDNNDYPGLCRSPRFDPPRHYA